MTGVDEYEIIDAISRRVGRLPGGYLQIGDDVAMIPVGGTRLVAKCDMLVARTDVPPGMSWRQAARKAVAMCVSDFAAKGVKPDSFMVSLALRRGTDEKSVRELASGFRDASKEWEVRLVGGDTNEADDLIIDCVMLGFGGDVVRRDSAVEGELVVTTGGFGATSAGLRILMEGAKSAPAFRRRALRSVYRPNPNLSLGLRFSSLLSSSMDSSDGLAISLHTIAGTSRVGIVLESLPEDSGLQRFASINGYEAADLVLYGGEEYTIVGTLKSERLEEARRVAESEGGSLRVIGRTTGERGSVSLADGREVERRGWVHLR